MLIFLKGMNIKRPMDNACGREDKNKDERSVLIKTNVILPSNVI